MKISIKAARTNKELSQKEAAKLLKISESSLQKYESGKISPTFETCLKMVELYQIPLDNLFIGK